MRKKAWRSNFKQTATLGGLLNCEFVHVVISNNAFASWHNRALWLQWLILITAKLSSRPAGQRSTLWADHRGSVTSSLAFLACRVTPDLQSDVVPRPVFVIVWIACTSAVRTRRSLRCWALLCVFGRSRSSLYLVMSVYLSLPCCDTSGMKHFTSNRDFAWIAVFGSCMIVAFASALLFCSLPWWPASELVLPWCRAFGDVLRGFLCLFRSLLGGNRIRFCCLVVRRCLCFHLPHLAGLVGSAVRRVRRCFLVFVLFARAWLASRLQLCWAPGRVSETRTSSLFFAVATHVSPNLIYSHPCLFRGLLCYTLCEVLQGCCGGASSQSAQSSSLPICGLQASPRAHQRLQLTGLRALPVQDSAKL